MNAQLETCDRDEQEAALSPFTTLSHFWEKIIQQKADDIETKEAVRSIILKWLNDKAQLSQEIRENYRAMQGFSMGIPEDAFVACALLDAQPEIRLFHRGNRSLQTICFSTLHLFTGSIADLVREQQSMTQFSEMIHDQILEKMCRKMGITPAEQTLPLPQTNRVESYMKILRYIWKLAQSKLAGWLSKNPPSNLDQSRPTVPD